MSLFNKDVKYLEGETEWSCECYEMVFKIPDDYAIPNNLNFRFKEYCFGNRWSLEWNGRKLFGENVQGRRSSIFMRKINMKKQKDAYGASGCFFFLESRMMTGIEDI